MRKKRRKKKTLMKMHQIRFCVSLGSPLDQVINPVNGEAGVGGGGRGGGGAQICRYII